MTFRSILYDDADREAETVEHSQMPDFFIDLNLDQLVQLATTEREQYELDEYFYTPLHSVAQIEYRHEVLRDLESVALREAIETFAKQMRDVREHLAQTLKLHYPRQQQAWFLTAADTYSQALTALTREPAFTQVSSRGFRRLHDYLIDYSASTSFQALTADITQLKANLAEVRYCLLINGNRVTVTKYDAQTDYTPEVEATFEKFKQGAVKDYRVTILDYLEMNHIEAQVLDQVARLYPETFAALTQFSDQHRTFIDNTIAVFDREVQFYAGYLQLIGGLEQGGLSFCQPHVMAGSKELQVTDTFDIVLADKLANDSVPIVTNNFDLTGQERILVVTGPNQGGKTTFARAFGQLHYLASLGLPVPGLTAQLFLFDQIFTHFEKEEDPTALRGKLEDDLIRIHGVLDNATTNSIVIMNELFSSTTLADAITLGTAVLRKLIGRGCLGVCVTFVDELSTLGPATVSLVSQVTDHDAAERTYKLERRPADGLSYAVTIAEKYGLTQARLSERIAR